MTPNLTCSNHRSNHDEFGDASDLPPKKKSKRGTTRCANLDKHVEKYGKIVLSFDEETGKPYGKWSSGFNNLISQLVKNEICARTTQWSNVDAHKKNRIVIELLGRFVFDYNNIAIRDNIEVQSMDKFRDWKSRLRHHFYKVKGDINLDEAKRQVPKDCEDDDWRWLCEYFNTPEQVAISTRNKANRGKKLYNSKQGSKSNIAHLYEMANKETNQLPNMVTMFHKMHWSEKTGWSNDLAMAHYDEMVARSTVEISTTEEEFIEEASLKKDQIHQDIVGKRSRYKKGIGALPRLKAFAGQGPTRAVSGTYSGSSSSSTQPTSIESIAEIQRLTKRLDKSDRRIEQQDALISTLIDIVSRLGPAVGIQIPPMPIFEASTTFEECTSRMRASNSSFTHAKQEQQNSLLRSSRRGCSTDFDNPYLS